MVPLIIMNSHYIKYLPSNKLIKNYKQNKEQIDKAYNIP